MAAPTGQRIGEGFVHPCCVAGFGRSRQPSGTWKPGRVGRRLFHQLPPIQKWSGRNAMHYRRISADCHLDMPWMPPDLFTSEASSELRDRMPYVADGPDGPQWVTKAGATFGLKNGVGPSGAKLCPVRTAGSTSWPRPACSPMAKRTSAGSAIHICG